MRRQSGKAQPLSKHGNLRHKAVVSARPKNLNLTTIHLPLPALISILHRASGAILFLIIPVLLYTLQTSLESDADFQTIKGISQHWFSKLILLGIAWAYIHHFLAGLRHLAHDAHWWEGLAQARTTGKLVLILSLMCTLLVGIKLW